MKSVANAEVGGASADIAGHRIINVCICWVSVLRKERRGRHDLPRLTVAALRDLFGDPCFLHRMKTICAEAFDRDNVFPVAVLIGD